MQSESLKNEGVTISGREEKESVLFLFLISQWLKTSSDDPMYPAVLIVFTSGSWQRLVFFGLIGLSQPGAVFWVLRGQLNSLIILQNRLDVMRKGN